MTALAPAQKPAEPLAANGSPVARRAPLRIPVLLGILAVVALGVFGFGAKSGETSTFAISLRSDAVQFDPWVVSVRPTTIALGVVLVALAAWSIWLALRGRTSPWWLLALYGLLWASSFLVWIVAGSSTSLVDLLQGSLLLAVPLAFGAFGGLLCERAGVVNIAIEGQLLVGAFAAAVVASVTGNVYAGLVAAPVAGYLLGLLLALFTVKYAVNQIIVGVVLNVLAVGLTSFLFNAVLKPNSSTLNSPPRLDPIAIPLVSKIPLVGPVFFRQNLLVYLLYGAVFLLTWLLFRTRWGLRVRAVGEHPSAADTVGIDVNRTRWRNVVAGSSTAGLGGAFFTIGYVGAFGPEMSGGRGYIALAAMILGRWTPVGSLGAALLFGFASKLASVLSVLDTPLPSQFLLMLPYVLTIFAVAGFVGRVRGPAAAGVPYVKG
ncbi:ABC transporter permease [Luteimicrobium subarcticum]|uniref:Nucleoside ABC transporter membrane protein n=1 Tax=Luteimicrobium subarcticum TaxID=620910 RepID=A0A2M8WUI3_9MICO|nr:ABC transporter permease [Luteimicrobium subarcticum]PJI94592.1 nucleoside ABC transporter membrane protein [Luteimicrobium subarcticum]